MNVITTKNSPRPYIIIGTNICTYLLNRITYESETLYASNSNVLVGRGGAIRNNNELFVLDMT